MAAEARGWRYVSTMSCVITGEPNGGDCRIAEYGALGAPVAARRFKARQNAVEWFQQ